MKIAIYAFILAVLANDPLSAQEATGKIVWSIVTTRVDGSSGYENSESFSLSFKSADGKHSDYASYSHGDIFGHSDFEYGTYKGGVKILTLPAGDWQIVGFYVTYNSLYFTPTKSFAIPFTVRAGQTTYIGSYAARWAMGENFLGIPVPGGITFKISDEGYRDIGLARKKDPSIGDVETAIPDISNLNIEYFSAEQPEK